MGIDDNHNHLVLEVGILEFGEKGRFPHSITLLLLLSFPGLGCQSPQSEGLENKAPTWLCVVIMLMPLGTQGSPSP